MNDPAAFTALFNHSRPMEKVHLALRLLEEATARKRASDESANQRARERSDRIDQLRAMLRIQSDDHAEMELADLEGGDREFRSKLAEGRRLADARYQADIPAPSTALDWLAEQAADMRAADKPQTPWLRHLRVTPKSVSTDKIAELRAEVVSINELMADVATRPATAKELKEQADAVLEQVSELGAISLNVRKRDRDPFALLSTLTQSHSTSSSHHTAQVLPGGVAVLIALLGDEFRQYLHNRIDAADLSGALSGDEQARELARLASRRLTLERQEEAVLCALEAQGILIPRRPDLDPRAFLEVEEL